MCVRKRGIEEGCRGGTPRSSRLARIPGSGRGNPGEVAARTSFPTGSTFLHVSEAGSGLRPEPVRAVRSSGPTRTRADWVRASDLRICAGQRVAVASRRVRRTLFPRSADLGRWPLTCENTARCFALAPPVSLTRADISRTRAGWSVRGCRTRSDRPHALHADRCSCDCQGAWRDGRTRQR